MAALTRIFNNQIQNSTIIGSQKIAPGTLTGSLFSSNVTVPGDLLISGNLFVLGSSAYTTIASTNTYVNDPLIVLNNGFSASNTDDQGLIFNRGSDQNQAFIWSEAFDEFRLVATNEDGTTYGNITGEGLARLSIGSLNVPGQANVGIVTAAGAITGASLNVTGNVLSTAGIFNALTVNGNETVTGYLNVTGNVMAAVITASQLNTTGNVLATAGTFNALTVNGNETVNGNGTITGFLNVTGNILGATATVDDLTANGDATVAGYLNVVGNVSTAQLNAGEINTTGNVLALGITVDDLAVNGDQTVAGFLNVTGNILGATATLDDLNVNGDIISAGFVNTTGNISTAQLNAGQINTTGNLLASGITVDDLTVNGDQTLAGYLNVTGNVIATDGTFTDLTVNGDVAGGLSEFAAINNTPIGNATASTGAFTILSATNNLWANASIATTAQGVGAIVIPNGGISVSGAANIAGSITTASAAQFNSTATVGGIFDITNTTNATDVSGETGALQVAGGGSIAKDLYVGGNLYVSNIYSTTYNLISVNDPLLYLDAGNSYPYTYDIGIYSNFVGPDPLTGTGNVYQHTGVIRDHTDYTWKFVSNVRGEPNGGMGVDSDTIFDPVQAGNLRLQYTDATALQVAGGAIIGGTVSAGQINTTGNILATAGTFNALTVNGNETVTGFLNVAGNVLASVVSASQINTTGNVLATAGTFNTLTVNGNETVTGYLNVTGNILGATATVDDLTVNGDITSAGFINTTGNISTAQLDAGEINTTGNVLATAGTFNALAVNGTVAANQLNTTGNVLATAGTFNALTVNGNETVTGYLNVTGNVMAAVITASQLNTTGNVLATAGTFNDLTVNGNETVTGYLNVTGNVMAAVITASQLNTTGNVLATAGTFNALTVNGNETVTGYLNVTGNVMSAAGTFNALTVNGSGSITSNLTVAEAVVINDDQTAYPFQVKGSGVTGLIYANADTDSVIIGGSNLTPQLGSTLKIGGTDSMLLPIGSTANRPSNSGSTDVPGMLRFNSTINNMEFYDGTTWQTAGSVFTVISSRQYSGNVAGGFGNVDGTNTDFTIQASSTTAATIVSINGVIQFPVLAYSVDDTTLTFTEAPDVSDVIDVRVLATTSVVSTITSGNGLNQFITSDTASEIWTGSAVTTKQVQVNRAGDFEIVNGGKFVYDQTAINIAANNTPYLISTWDNTALHSAKYLIGISKDGGTNVQSMEAHVLSDHNGNAFVQVYGVVNNGVSMGDVTANVVGGNVQVYFTTTTNMTNANVKAMGTYLAYQGQ